ncbi:MAG: hypothetical protein JW956_06245 [Calditrichaceae bacterium]|nr:hypothetical protein [Calditrichaceae bacterium]
MKKMHKGISRIDSKNTHGWYVRIYANGGVFVSKLFSDRLHGGKQQALKDAISYRDHNQMVADLKRKDMRSRSKRPFYSKPPKNNTSGVVGVNEILSTSNGKKVHYFQATWSENGKARSKKYYITPNRTTQQAREAAIQHRLTMVNKLEENWLSNPDKD